MQLPEKFRFILEESFKTDNVGMSDSTVLIFNDKVLKIQKCSKESQNEYRMMSWLQDKLPVPKILCYEIMDNKSFLLMSRLSGEMSCERKYMEAPEKQVQLLAEGMNKLWNIDISDCPSDCSLNRKLIDAEYNVENGLVDIENAEPDTFGSNGFRNSQALLQWLYQNKPQEEPVLSHGDYCLPNVFFHGNELAGFVDLGKMGVADKWCDIALCYRSLSNNYSGRYHGRTYSNFDDLLLFRELGIEPNWEKIRYYILLDELF